MKDDLDTRVGDLRSAMNTTQPKPGYAIVGTGMMGREHIRAIMQLNQASIVGLYDVHADSLKRAMDTFSDLDKPAPKRYANLADIAADPDVDAIFICTPNYTHRQIFDALKASNKALFLEKPMATTLEDAFYIAEQALNYPAPIQLGMQYRYKAQYQLALASLANGELGAVKMVALSEYRPPFLPKVAEWNKFAAYSGGTLVEKCCHYFDLMNRIAGCPPVRVYASGGRAVNFIDFHHESRASDIDDHAFVIVDYANGIKGQFTLNMFSEALYESLTVGGDRGTLRAREYATFEPGGRSRSDITVQVTGHPAYEGMDCTFPDDIETGGHYGSTLFEHQRFSQQLAGADTDAATCAEGLWAIITAWMAQESITAGAAIDVHAALKARSLDPYRGGLLPHTWETNRDTD